MWGLPVLYDSFGQLTRENNKILDKTLIYSYDSIGNITSVKTYNYTTEAVSGTPTEETFTYNTTYKDRFRKIGNYSVNYNTDGCPTKVIVGLKPISYTWDKGRLASVLYSDSTNGSKRYSFTYDGYGRRISKSYTFTVGSTVPTSYIASAITNYTYDTKGKLIKENYTATSNTSSTTTKEIVYLYDESNIVGMIYTVNGTSATYYLDKNIKGDVLRIYGSTGNVVAEYRYDAYGNCTILSSTNADLANFNPIRYRGYYYDTETGLYYLNARYYNPEWRRFLSPTRSNALNPEVINGLNSYVYAGNNPITTTYQTHTNSTTPRNNKGYRTTVNDDVSPTNQQNRSQNNIGVALNFGVEIPTSFEYLFIFQVETGTGYSKTFDTGKAINFYLDIPFGYQTWTESSMGIDINYNGYGLGFGIGRETSLTLHLGRVSLDLFTNSLARTGIQISHQKDNGQYDYWKFEINIPELLATVLTGYALLYYFPMILENFLGGKPVYA